MFDFAQQMTFYSAYHQERRNVITHIFGVPIITFSFFVVMHWLELTTISDFPITLAVVVYALTTLYYVSLDSLFGAIAGLLYGSLLYAAYQIATMGYQVGLIIFAACQIGGWGAQIFAHAAFEKGKPAFLDNLFQSFVSAPLFVVADVLFMLGIRKSLAEKIHESLRKQGRLREVNVGL